MREKYVDEQFPPLWFMDGADGKKILMAGQDFVDDNEDIVQRDQKKHAMLVKLALAFAIVAPEEFEKVWYDRA